MHTFGIFIARIKRNSFVKFVWYFIDVICLMFYGHLIYFLLLYVISVLSLLAGDRVIAKSYSGWPHVDVTVGGIPIDLTIRLFL